MTEKIKKRLYALGWQTMMMALAFVIDGLIKMLSDNTLDIPQIYVVFGGLVLAGISKALNNQVMEK